jgi:hypothetical protein
MILLWGLPGDTPMAHVRDALVRRGQPVGFVNQEEALDTELEPRGDVGVDGILRVGRQEIDLGLVTAAYLRSYGLDQLPAVRALDRWSRERRRIVATYDALLAWTEMTPAFVVNRVSAMATNCKSSPWPVLT